ncbi:hypothetical protein LTR86_007996 [Recurvomyces mirabilis]|nr:hypothetical protein LTR86_007996 [Recurvomyces mirabilis]
MQLQEGTASGSPSERKPRHYIAAYCCARCDSIQDWWYAELISYFQAFARRNDLYPRIQFKAELKAASWDEKEGLWHLDLSTGEKLTTRYLVTAIGILHRPSLPKLPGLETFKGEVVHSAQWRDELNPYIKKRVAVIGAGASGVQLVGALSETAQYLTHFVRHAQYVLPAQMRLVGPEERSLINSKYDQTWTDVFTSAVAMGFVEPNRPALSVSPEDRERIFQNLWNQGSGFRFMFGGFSDIASDEAANKEASAFIHRKIREIVKDEQKVDVLTSTDWFARRPLTDDRYYQAFNQENVAAVDLEKTPIEEIVPDGIKTADGKVHELDLIIFATGFDSVDGTYYYIDFKGKDDKRLPEQWKDGLSTYLGLQTSSFPNLFFVNGPGAPYANNPPVAEDTARFSAELIEHSEKLRKEGSGTGVIESTPEADAKWLAAIRKVSSQSLFQNTSSWLFGENIDGRTESPRFWFGGVGRWRAEFAKAKAAGYEGFQFELPTQFDHVIILLPYKDITDPPKWVTDNFTVSSGGRHSDGKTENRLVIFKDGTYLELIAFIDDEPQKRKGHWWDKPYGIVDFALTTEKNFDYDGLQKRLQKSGSGISYTPSQEGGRRTPDGQELKWKVTFPKGAERGEVPFWCHDVTPRERRVPIHNGKTDHPCHAVGLSGLHIKTASSKVEHLESAMVAITESKAVKDGHVAVGAPVPTGIIADNWVAISKLASDSADEGSLLELTLRTPGRNGVPPIRQDVESGSVMIDFDGSE